MKYNFNPGVLVARARNNYPDGFTIIAIMLLSFMLLVVMSLFLELDIVSSCKGTIQPLGKTSLIKSSSSGYVTHIYAKDGVVVKKGDKLIELNSTELDVEIAHQKALLLDLNNRISILKTYESLMLSHAEDGEYRYKSSLSSPGFYNNLAAARFNSFIDSIKMIHDDMASIKKELTIQHELQRKINSTEMIQLKKLEAVSVLAKKGVVSRYALLETKDGYEQSVFDVNINREKIKKLSYELTAKKNSIGRVKNEFLLDVMNELRSINVQKDEVTAALNKLDSKKNDMTIKATDDGLIQELAVNYPGEYVNVEQPLMRLVPQKADYYVEFNIPNKDVGFVRASQNVRIKVDSYPYLRYGYITSKVRLLSADADISGLERNYVGLTEKIEGSMSSGGFVYLLRAGMKVEAEVITGKRKLYEYFLQPILDEANGALSER
jgi:hemolysin D